METPSPTTADVVTTFLQHLGQQNAEGIAACFAEDIDWFVPGDPSLPWTGRRTRGAQVADYFRTMWPQFVPGHSTANVEKMLYSGPDVVVLGTFSHTVASTGRAFTTPVALHLVVENGKIVKLSLYEDTWMVGQAFAH
jgi:ketosteroid isomerase-like protein